MENAPTDGNLPQSLTRESMNMVAEMLPYFLFSFSKRVTLWTPTIMIVPDKGTYSNWEISVRLIRHNIGKAPWSLDVTLPNYMVNLNAITEYLYKLFKTLPVNDNPEYIEVVNRLKEYIA